MKHFTIRIRSSSALLLGSVSLLQRRARPNRAHPLRAACRRICKDSAGPEGQGCQDVSERISRPDLAWLHRIS